MITKADGIYYRVERDGKWQNICFTDLTDEEREKLCDDYGAEQWQRVALHLANQLRSLYELLDASGLEVRQTGWERE